MVPKLTLRPAARIFGLGLAHGRLLVLMLMGAALLTGCPDGVSSNCTEIEDVDGGDGGTIVICEDETDGGVDEDCTYFCSLEEECGFRTFDACTAQACPGGEWLLSVADGCVEAAADCGEVALCTCEARCDNETACFGSEDPGCAADCQSLAEQFAGDAYLESRCVLESPCDDIALCSG